MKVTRSALACLAAISLILTRLTADEKQKPAKITLEDVIFDVSYLKQQLGPKTLVTAVVETNRGRKKADTALEDAVKAVKEAHLNDKSQIFLLPDGATEPVLQSSIPHNYGPGIKLSRYEKKANFLMLIGADGAVKCLYCYDQNDRLFALAAAMAVVKWRYEPARIQGTAVPVLAGLPMLLYSQEVRLMNPARRNSTGGIANPYRLPSATSPRSGPPPSGPPR